MSIELHNIKKSYGTKIVLNNISLKFEEGCSYCLTGHSGCGKTTLLHILMGILDFDFGEITGLSKKSVSVVFQEDRLLENLSVGTNIKIVCEKHIKRKQIEDILKKVRLSDCYSMKVSELSGGMKRRVSIARALMAKSDVLIMDEPFKGLDKKTKISVMNCVKEETIGKTVIWVSHDKEEPFDMGSVVVCF